MAPTLVSAPGKVLLAGGYLVLDRAHTGLVFGLDARIYAHVAPLSGSLDHGPPAIIVKSPQFLGAEWRYEIEDSIEGNGISLTQVHRDRNKFVETALAFALTYVSTMTKTQPGSISITILADKSYYSNPGTIRPNSHFLDFGISLAEAHKTGLGSSAALVTALTAALVTYCLSPQEIDLISEKGKSRLHNLAQAAHCAAQGKIGSGFDVTAAVYGSCLYKRFSPEILERLGDVGSSGFGSRLRSIVDNEDPSTTWDTVVDKSFGGIPRSLRLLMCDVDCGTESVGMAKTVLKWRKEKPEEATLLWATLQKGTDDLAHELQSLSIGAEGSDRENLISIILTIRSLVREMSAKVGVPIEPEVQTMLLDGCGQMPGVIGGVVPGAGGFDAIALLVENDESTVADLQGFLNSYVGGPVTEDGKGIGKVKLLDVQQESHGLRTESVSLFDAWVG